MLLGTVQLVARLHRISLATALATDAAHRVAEAGTGPAAARARQEAERRIRVVLGDQAAVEWSEDPSGPAVEVTVAAPRLPGLADEIRRGAQARREQPT